MITVPWLTVWAEKDWEWRRMSPWQRFPRAFALISAWHLDAICDYEWCVCRGIITIYAEDMRCERS